MIKAITFDFWNTLYVIPADQSLSERRVKDMGTVLEAAGLKVAPQLMREAFKYGWYKAWYQQRAYGKEISPSGQVQYIIEKLGVKLSSATEDKIFLAYTGTLLEVPPVINHDVLETLPALAQKYKLAIICNTGATPGTVLRKIVNKDKLDVYFKVMVFSDEVGFAKPSTQIFNYTLQHLGIENHAAVHIGDDPITDAIGAKRAGMTSVWLAPEEQWAVPEADYHVCSVKELLTLF